VKHEWVYDENITLFILSIGVRTVWKSSPGYSDLAFSDDEDFECFLVVVVSKESVLLALVVIDLTEVPSE